MLVCEPDGNDPDHLCPVQLTPGVRNHQQREPTDNADRLPALLTIEDPFHFRNVKRIGKDLLAGFKRDAVLAQIGSGFHHIPLEADCITQL
jgi:hypothetical protein